MCCFLAYRKMLTKDQVRNQDPEPCLEYRGPNEDSVPKILFTRETRTLWQIREQELFFKLLFITFLGKIGSNLSFCREYFKKWGKNLNAYCKETNAFFLHKNIFVKNCNAYCITKSIFIDEGLKYPGMTDWSKFIFVIWLLVMLFKKRWKRLEITILTRTATRCNNHDDLLHLNLTLKISIFSEAYI